MKHFGDYIRDLRIKNNLTLRAFCKITNFDPGNWSRIERGILKPPSSKTVLENIVKAVQIIPGSEDYYILFDLAAVGHLPPEITDSIIVEKLPLFFRTIRGEQPTRENLEELVEIIRKDALGID